MAQPSNLMAFGMAPDLARRVGMTVKNVTAQGNSRASANGIIGHNAIAYVVASNSGSGLVLPTVGGDISATAGALPGDELTVFNLLSASIVVYAPSGMTFVGMGASTDGATGISVAANFGVQFQVLTATTYGFLKGSA